MFSVMSCPPANAHCCGKSPSRSVARTVSLRCRISGRAMELVNVHESFLALSSRRALSIFGARFQFARASFLVSREPAMVNGAFGTKCILGELSVFCEVNWSLPLACCLHAVRVHRRGGFAFAVRERMSCSWLRKWFAVSERTRYKRSSRSIRARSRALRSTAPEVSLECSRLGRG